MLAALAVPAVLAVLAALAMLVDGVIAEAGMLVSVETSAVADERTDPGAVGAAEPPVVAAASERVEALGGDSPWSV